MFRVHLSDIHSAQAIARQCLISFVLLQKAAFEAPIAKTISGVWFLQLSPAYAPVIWNTLQTALFLLCDDSL